MSLHTFTTHFSPLLTVVFIFFGCAVHAQHCEIRYVSDLTASDVSGFQFSQGWRLRNPTSSCDAFDYYLAPQSAQISTDNRATWQSYSGMNLRFRRIDGPRQNNDSESDRFTLPAGAERNIFTWFNVSPNDSDVHYRVFFDIYTGSDQVLTPLPGGRLFTEFYYPAPEADLEIQDISVAPQTAAPGESVTIDFTVVNVGFSDAGPNRLKIYYSHNSSWSSSSDLELDDILISGLSAGSSRDYQATVTIPNSASDGNRYLFLYVDANGQVDEIQEGSRNREKVSLQIASSPTNDYFISDLSVMPQPARWGDDLLISYRHNYQGNQEILPVAESRIYLSQDQTISGDDILVDTDNADLSSTNTSDSESSTYILTNASPEGRNYIIVQADASNAVSEDNESNNVSIIPLDVAGTLNYFTSNETVDRINVQAGGEIFVNCQLLGNGLDFVFVGYFISSDCLFDPDFDERLERDNNNFEISSVGIESATLDIPANLPTGTYYILFVTDYEDDIIEVNENDNLHCIQIAVTGTCISPTAGFVTPETEIDQGEGIFINNTSSGAETYSWTFEDGNPGVWDDRFPPTVVFDHFGDKSISLTVTNACGSDTETKSIRVRPDQSQTPPDYSNTRNTAYAGDPVDMATGAFVYAVEDLSVGGVNGQYAWRRFYNSQYDQHTCLGWNWTHAYDIVLEFSGSQWIVKHGNGQRTYFAAYPDGTTIPMYSGTLDTIYRNGATQTYTFERQNGTKYLFNASGEITSATDRSGNTTQFTYTSNRLSRISFPGGRYFDLTYSGSRISTVTDNIGRKVMYGYSSSGDMTSSTDVRGNSSTITYDGTHQMLTMVDGRGNTTVTNTYDANRRVVSQFDSEGFTTSIAYDAPTAGTVTMTNPLSGTTQYEHNSYDRLVRFVNEINGEKLFGFDTPTGKLKSIQNELGKSIFHGFDDDGNLTITQDQLANQTLLEYGVFNRPTAIENALGNRTTMVLDAKGNAIQTTFPNGGVASAVFNAKSEMTSRTTPLGRTTNFIRNTFGDIIEIETPTGSYLFGRDGIGRMTSITDRNGNTTTLTLNAAGNIIEATDAKGNTTFREFDENGNLVRVVDRLGAITLLAYDSRNLLIQITDPLGYVKTFEYDALQRLVKTTDSNDNEVAFTYDPRGQLLTVTDALGTYSFGYDAVGNMTSFTDALGNTTLIEYDDANRPVRVIDPIGNESSSVYDAIGRVISSTDANGNTTQNGYDVMGWLTSITDALGGVVQYNRDLEGNISGYTDANGNTTSITRNVLDLPTAITYPGGYQKTATYDNEGILLTSTDENGITATHSYDANYNHISTSFSNGAAYSFSFDLEDRLLSFGNGEGTTTLERDIRGFITKTIDPFGSETLNTHDGEGNRTAITYPGGNTVTTSYNGVNLPVTVTDWLSNATTRSYDANSNVSGMTRTNGTASVITRDALQRIATYEELDGNGDRIIKNTLSYDPVGNVLSTNPDRLLEPAFMPTMEALQHAADDRITQREGVTVTHDDNGAQVSVGGSTPESYTWLQEDLLGSFTRNGSTTVNTYDPFRQRLSKAVDGTTTQFTIDQTTPLPMVLQETRNGTVTDQYIYGPEGLDWKVDAQGNAQFFHFNFIGHTRALTDESGEVTDAYASDPWGDFANHLGSSQQPFTYLGKYGIENEGNGFHYDRARFYDAALGRFISKDAAPITGGTQGANKYIYGFNNPLRFIDIDGNQAQYGQGSVAGFNQDISFYNGESPSQSFDVNSLYGYNTEAYQQAVLQYSSNANSVSNHVQTNPTKNGSYTIQITQDIYTEPIFQEVQSGAVSISFYNSILDYNDDGVVSNIELILGITEGLVIAFDIYP